MYCVQMYIVHLFVTNSQPQVQSFKIKKMPNWLSSTVPKSRSKTKDDINKAIDLLWIINRGSFITRKAPQVIKIRLC